MQHWFNVHTYAMLVRSARSKRSSRNEYQFATGADERKTFSSKITPSLWIGINLDYNFPGERAKLATLPLAAIHKTQYALLKRIYRRSLLSVKFSVDELWLVYRCRWKLYRSIRIGEIIRTRSCSHKFDNTLCFFDVDSTSLTK